MGPLDELLLQMARSIRVGHATNSSSTHSIVLLTDQQVRDLPNRPPEEGDLDYGWENFVLTTREQKLDYLWANLRQQVAHLSWAGRSSFYLVHELGIPLLDVSESVVRFASQVASGILEHTPDGIEANPLASASVDHDSAFSFPLSEKTQFPDVGFARWFRERVLHPNVAILGGNDNEKRPADMPVGTSVREFLEDDEHQHPMLVLDRTDHWLLWSAEEGKKVRVPKREGDPIPFSSVPELVDVKITDQCGMGCAFCYQGSTPTGKHAPAPPHILAATIAKLGVREVAIGGGEPLEYPDFWTLVNQLRDRGLSVNVTTRRPDLIPTWRLEKFGGVGYSVENPSKAAQMLDRLGIGPAAEDAHDNPWREKLVLHLVLGAAPTGWLVKIARLAAEAHVPVLLLGYKTDGRGASFQPHAHDNWIDQFRSTFRETSGGRTTWRGPALGVDTPIVERWGGELVEKLQVDPRYMTAGEGAFSLYVDFVAQEIRKASYGGAAHEAIPLASVPKREEWRRGDIWADQALAAFRGWHEPRP